MTLSGRRIIVTGASSGLGAHTVRWLAGDGADVLAVARRQDRLDRLAADLADAPGRVMPFQADVTSAQGCQDLAAAATSTFGGIDVLVNNAGSEVQGGIERLALEDLEAMTRALAMDLGRDGIRVNVIRPGIIPSELRGSTEAQECARFEGGGVTWRQAVDRVGHGQDIAAAIAWLAAEDDQFVTGAVIDVDGGFSLGLADHERA